MCIIRISLLLTLLPTPKVQLANYRNKPQHILIHSTPLYTIPQITNQPCSSVTYPSNTLQAWQRSPSFNAQKITCISLKVFADPSISCTSPALLLPGQSRQICPSFPHFQYLLPS
ncbi:hypothetical protein F4781DRAFT_394821 [Annulohypoxylon bovei var. microspora]|nr:hypothetical protein F4781DRAFT_394821 [Annulohypoxylon bovei var. microspora]